MSAIVSMAAQVSLPLIIAAVIDGPLARGDRGGILRWCLFAVVDVGLTYARRIWLAIVATEMGDPPSQRLYEHLQALDVDFHDQWKSGQLLSRSTTDLAIVRRFAGSGAVLGADRRLP